MERERREEKRNKGRTRGETIRGKGKRAKKNKQDLKI